MFTNLAMLNGGPTLYWFQELDVDALRIHDYSGARIACGTISLDAMTATTTQLINAARRQQFWGYREMIGAGIKTWDLYTVIIIDYVMYGDFLDFDGV